MSAIDITIDTAFSSTPVDGTPIHWYLNKLKESGITRHVATLCKLSLKLDDTSAYIRIPYFTVDGVETPFSRQRNRDEVVVFERPQSGGNFRGKYTQPSGSKSKVYWPNVASQRKEFNDPGVPLLVCEGEFKSIAAKMAVTASGLEVLVAGVPGTFLPESVLQELREISCIGTTDPKTKEKVRRVVYISADWGGRGKSRESSTKLEFTLKELFQTLGARVVLLRWDVGGVAGEQKLDDWLVAGGDISVAMDHSREETEGVKTAISEKWDYFNKTYAILHGRYVPLLHPAQRYTITDFNIMEAYNRVPVGPKKTLEPVEVWKLQPPDQQNRISGYTFLPAPLGSVPDRYVWEDGNRMLNTAPVPLEAVAVMPWDEVEPVREEEVAPFLGLLARLCQDGAPWFAKFLAQAAQAPTVRGPHIIIFKDEGGTGKSRLFETLDLVFGRYSGPVGTSMTSSFNAELEHLVLAWWSDPVIHGGFDRDLESALKNFSGDSKISINHKGGAKYTVRNYGRLLIATNKDWLVPVGSKERRFTVFGGSAPMPHTEAGAYMRWLEDGGAALIRRWLVEMDLSGFDIQAPGPLTDQRREMELVSRPTLVRLLDEEPFTARDIWTPTQLRDLYKEATGKTLDSASIGLQLNKLGCPCRIIRIREKVYRCRVIRNFSKWDMADNSEWITEMSKVF